MQALAAASRFGDSQSSSIPHTSSLYSSTVRTAIRHVGGALMNGIGQEHMDVIIAGTWPVVSNRFKLFHFYG